MVKCLENVYTTCMTSSTAERNTSTLPNESALLAQLSQLSMSAFLGHSYSLQDHTDQLRADAACLQDCLRVVPQREVLSASSKL